MAKELQIYTATEVCALLKVSRRTLYRYISEGKINTFRAGMEYRFTQEDIEEYIAKTRGKRMYRRKKPQEVDA